MTLVNVHFAFQSSETIRAGTVHSILLLLGMSGQVEFVIRVLVPLDTEPARSSIAIQVTDRLDIALNVTYIARPALVAGAALVTIIGIFNASSMICAEGILLILIEARHAVRGALLLATHPGVGNLVGMSRVTITHGTATIIIHA